MWVKRVAISLVILLASVTILTVMAAAGVIHCHELDHSHHGLLSSSCCTDKIFTLSGCTPLIIQDNQNIIQQFQLIPPQSLFVAEIFQPPRS